MSIAKIFKNEIILIEAKRQRAKNAIILNSKYRELSKIVGETYWVKEYDENIYLSKLEIKRLNKFEKRLRQYVRQKINKGEHMDEQRFVEFIMRRM